jgi:hypothetical protein
VLGVTIREQIDIALESNKTKETQTLILKFDRNVFLSSVNNRMWKVNFSIWKKWRFDNK